MELRAAIMVDGGFYRRRAKALYGDISPQDRANELETICKNLLYERNSRSHVYLYRVFYYDCPPSVKKVYHPLLQRTVDLGRSCEFTWMTDFLRELKKKRKFALRMGELSDSQIIYTLNAESVKKLCRKEITVDDLKEESFILNIEQKGVDMKLGLDIASVAYKKQVDRIYLISGDSDFVPAAKLARREGIDVILVPMEAHVKDNLFEHIDGIRRGYPHSGNHNSHDEALEVAVPLV